MALKRRGEVATSKVDDSDATAAPLEVEDPRPKPGLGLGGERVTATWAEEKYTLVANSFSTVTVGPFTLSCEVPPGASVGAVFDRLNRHLAEMAEIERERKLQSFLNKLQQKAVR